MIINLIATGFNGIIRMTINLKPVNLLLFDDEITIFFHQTEQNNIVKRTKEVDVFTHKSAHLNALKISLVRKKQ